MNTFRLLLSNIVVGSCFAAAFAASGTAIAFSGQALEFLCNQFIKGKRSPYTLFLATGIFLCSVGLALTFINVVLVMSGRSGSPVRPGASLLAVAVAVAGYALMAFGYCLHLIAWHATKRKEGRVFPWLWGSLVFASALIGGFTVWAYRN